MMIAAFLLSLRQMTDRKVLGVLAKSTAISLVLFALLGSASWWLIQRGLADWLPNEGISGLAALVVVLLGGWLLWRILALAVIQLFADEVVMAVEQQHYPAAFARARRLGLREELGNGLKGAGRALGFNLLALPVAIALLVTGIGPAVVFWLVNAVLLGRELTEMVWQRHRESARDGLPLSGLERLMLGGMTTALLTVPFANLLAPVMGAAMATHMVHRKRAAPHAA